MGPSYETCCVFTEDFQQHSKPHIVGLCDFAHLVQEQPCHQKSVEVFWAVAMAKHLVAMWEDTGCSSNCKSKETFGTATSSQDTCRQNQKDPLDKQHDTSQENEANKAA